MMDLAIGLIGLALVTAVALVLIGASFGAIVFVATFIHDLLQRGPRP